jgi:hypothetical protein
MIERADERFDLYPERLAGDAPQRPGLAGSGTGLQ